MAKRDRTEVMLQKCWLRAADEGRFELEFDDELTASRMRFALYRAVADARRGEGSPELCAAVEGCVLTVAKRKVLLLFRDRQKETEVLERALRIRVSDIVLEKTAKELEAEESAARFLEKLKGEV